MSIHKHSLFLRIYYRRRQLKLNIIRIILIIALLGTFGIIFGFSNQNAETSGGISQKVTKYIIKIIPQLQKLENMQKEKIINQIEKIVRKIAHFTIYTLVGFLLMSLMITYKMKEMNQIGMSLIIGLVYASSDEIHQAFIPGRSAQLTDVILDTIGVLAGIFISILLVEIFRKFSKKKCINIHSKVLN